MAGLQVYDEIDLMDKNPIKYLKNIKKLRQIVNKDYIDMLHPHISRDHTFAYLSTLGRSIPIIRTRTDSIPPKNNPINRFFYVNSAKQYIISAGYMLPVLKDMGIEERSISIVPPEINYKIFSNYHPKTNLKKELGIPQNKIVISFIGRLDKIKGVEYFIDSYSFLRNRDKFHFIISGEEINLTAEYLRKAADHQKIENISFLGRVDDVREILSITDIGVIPSVGSEAICRIALEMLSFGIPIIGSNVNSIPEIISEFDGVVVNSGEPEEIADAIEKLSNVVEYNKTKNNIRSKIENRNPDKFITSYLDIYSKVFDQY